MDRATYTVKEAAEIVGIGTRTYYDKCHTGEVPYKRIGKRVVVPIHELDEFLRKKPQEPDPVEARRAELLRKRAQIDAELEDLPC
jgi:excisionase family DNA binding protein